MINMARNRGTTRNRTGLIAMTSSASISSPTFMVPSSAVTADPLRPYTVGTGASQVTVQQKTINGAGTIQEVPVRSGRAEIIGGIELTTSQTTSRRMGEGVPIIAGGSNVNARTKAVTVLLVTATVEEGI